MVVIVLEKVPQSLKGELSRWMIELKSGIFIGNISARVRELLWTKVCGESKGNPCILIWESHCEQGFNIEFWGKPSRIPTNWEGLMLTTKPLKP